MSQPTTPLNNIDGTVQEMIDGMANTMYEAPGIGLAAIQVGWDKSVLIMIFLPAKKAARCKFWSTLK